MRVDSPINQVDNEVDDTRRHLAAACERAAQEAMSANTERALRADLAIFGAWCAEHGLPALPASAKTLATFVDAMAKGRGRAPATVRRYIASIAAAHRAAGASGTTSNEPVRRALARMHQDKGRRQRQAEGLTWALRNRMLEATGDDLVGARNRALLALAYDTMLRRSEIVALEVSDIVEEIDGAGTVLVRRAKGDPEGHGAQVYLARDSLALVREWLGRSGVHQRKVFRSLTHGVVGEQLWAGQIPRIFKRMARDAGLPAELIEQISGHSTRVGATQDMVAGGIASTAIQHAGRWKTATMVNRYAERLLAQRSGAAQLARLQQRG